MWGRSRGVQNEDYTSAMWKLNVYMCLNARTLFSIASSQLPSSFSAYSTGLAIPASSAGPALTRCSPAMSAFLIGPLCHCYISAAVKTRVKICLPSTWVVRFQFSESLINICALPEDVRCCLAVNKSTRDATFGPGLRCCCGISHFFPARKNLETHLWPISCAMVKAEPRPMSSLMLQLLSGSHIPATEAKPEHTKQTSRQKEVQNKAGSRNWECKIDQITVYSQGKLDLYPFQ